MHKKSWIAGGLLLALLAVALTVMLLYKGRSLSGGLFCWDKEVLQPQQSRELWTRMQRWDLDELYQALPKDPDEGADFLQQAADRDIAVYMLVGDPSWGLDPEGRRLVQEAERAAQWQEQLGETAPAGLMVDVEPYLSEEWDQDPQQAMESYVMAMRAGYQAARSRGVTFLACIPWYYDTWGFSAELETLIRECCDGVAVMNYYKGSEGENLGQELELAVRFDKSIRTIYEMQPPGTHGLTEKNTYYEQGLPAVMENWRGLRRTLNDGDRLGFALHDYAALLLSENTEVENDE